MALTVKQIPHPYAKLAEYGYDPASFKSALESANIPFGTDVVALAPGVIYDVSSGEIHVEKPVGNAYHYDGDTFLYDIVKQCYVKQGASSGAMALAETSRSAEAVLASFRVKPLAAAGAAQPVEPPQKPSTSSYASSGAGTVGGGPWVPPGALLMTLEDSSGKKVQTMINAQAPAAEMSSIVRASAESAYNALRSAP